MVEVRKDLNAVSLRRQDNPECAKWRQKKIWHCPKIRSASCPNSQRVPTGKPWKKH